MLSESPLITASQDLKVSLPGLADQLAALPEHDQTRYLSLHDAHSKDGPTAKGIFITNSLPLGDSDVATQRGLFPECSRFNHSCNPNACNTWNSALQKVVVYAVEDIQPGVEITITYLSTLTESHVFRQFCLWQGFRFKCQCSVCTLPPAELAASDARRQKINALRNEASNTSRTNPVNALKCCRMALQLAKEEGWTTNADVHMTYWCALLMCIMHGDYARASAFARLAAQVMTVFDGKESTELKETLSYIKHPEKHYVAGTTGMWRSRTKNARALNSEGFEEWLWSRVA